MKNTPKNLENKSKPGINKLKTVKKDIERETLDGNKKRKLKENILMSDDSKRSPFVQQNAQGKLIYKILIIRIWWWTGWATIDFRPSTLCENKETRRNNSQEKEK